MGVRLADFVVNECGFAADLGAEKYFDIVMRLSGIEPAAVVLVASVQSLRAQGEGKLEAGFANLHSTSNRFAVMARLLSSPSIAFRTIPPKSLRCSPRSARLQGVPCALVEAFAKGGEGAAELAHKVVSAIETNPAPEIQPVYSLDDPLETKILKVAIQVYGADGVTFSDAARAKLDRYVKWGFGQAACLHRQDTVLAHRRSEAHGRADRVDAERQRRFALCWRRICGCHRRQHDADAGTAEPSARVLSRCGRRRQHYRRLTATLEGRDSGY